MIKLPLIPLLPNPKPHYHRHRPPTIKPHRPVLALTCNILYRQLMHKTRFISLCGSENDIVPKIVLALTPQQLRQIGVSGRKARYLHDLPRKCQNKILFDSAILNMDGKLLFIMLTIVNGIGSCFVHMFMIFSLHRPNVLPITLGSGRGFSFSTTSRTCHVPRRWTSYGTSAIWNNELRREIQDVGNNLGFDGSQF
ncbi:hypothetical protein JHK87_045046 [Glycine soja]|nr:hypothetical protein JHK87_045046 [Glycine soja]